MIKTTKDIIEDSDLFENDVWISSDFILNILNHYKSKNDVVDILENMVVGKIGEKSKK